MRCFPQLQKERNETHTVTCTANIGQKKLKIYMTNMKLGEDDKFAVSTQAGNI